MRARILGLNTLFDWWWADPVMTLFLIPVFSRRMGSSHLDRIKENNPKRGFIA
jgi:hypothetical protein